MVDPQSPNKFLNQPLHGSDIGTWDVPLNANVGIVDNSFGGLTTQALTNANVTLSVAQYQCAFIRFTGTLTGNVAITFPNVGSFYTIDNQCTLATFGIALQSTVAGSQAIYCPPGEAFDIWSDGATGNLKYRNFGRVGSYMDLATTTVPSWITSCTVPPYLNCNVATFSSATYPALRDMLGSNTLPDARGKARYTLNQGSTITTLSTAGAGIDGNTLKATGGQNGVTLTQANLPNYNLTITSCAHSHDSTQFGFLVADLASISYLDFTYDSQSGTNQAYSISGLTGESTIPITVSLAGSTTTIQNAAPGYVGGITLIRAG